MSGNDYRNITIFFFQVHVIGLYLQYYENGYIKILINDNEYKFKEATDDGKRNQ